METKTIFLSYSWTTENHQNWVTSLANRLVQDGVEVKFDKWDLKEGHDKYSFMESMVKSTEIDKVIIVLDKQYADRANERSGGVGTETLIITPEVYSDAKQEKFIPLVTEVDDEGKAYLPVYLSGRIYIDFSDAQQFELGYEKLLRSIFNRPSLTKPKLGVPPSYLFADAAQHFKSNAMLRGLEEQLNRNPNRANLILKDFLDEFYKNLLEFIVERQDQPTNTTVGEAMADKLKQYAPLRSDYIHFMDKFIKAGIVFDEDIILRFFEKLPLLFAPQDENVMSWQTYQYSHFKLIAHELFIYTVAIGLKNHNYEFLESIFHSKYLFRERGRQKNIDNFTGLYFHFDSMDEYFKKLKDRNYYSVQAELIIANIPDDFAKEDLVNADLLCYFIAQLNGWSWFPKTYVYKNEYSDSFDFFNRLISKKHFEKVKNVLNVETVEQLQEKITKVEERGPQRGYDYGFSRIPTIDSFIKKDHIGSAR